MSDTKYYYTITEVSRMLDVNPSLLRYWETEFPTLHPHKTANGTRRYTQADIDLLKRIHHLTKQCGFTLEGAREQLRHPQTTAADSQQLTATLQSLRSFLVSLRDQLD